VLALPRRNIVGHQLRVRIAGCTRGDVNDGQWGDETLDREALGAGAIGREVRRGIHVGACVLVEDEEVLIEAIALDRAQQSDLHLRGARVHREGRRDDVAQVVNLGEAAQGGRAGERPGCGSRDLVRRAVRGQSGQTERGRCARRTEPAQEPASGHRFVHVRHDLG
jgi:hypothetical protein